MQNSKREIKATTPSTALLPNNIAALNKLLQANPHLEFYVHASKQNKEISLALGSRRYKNCSVYTSHKNGQQAYNTFIKGVKSWIAHFESSRKSAIANIEAIEAMLTVKQKKERKAHRDKSFMEMKKNF